MEVRKPRDGVLVPAQRNDVLFRLFWSFCVRSTSRDKLLPFKSPFLVYLSDAEPHSLCFRVLPGWPSIHTLHTFTYCMVATYPADESLVYETSENAQWLLKAHNFSCTWLKKATAQCKNAQLNPKEFGYYSFHLKFILRSSNMATRTGQETWGDYTGCKRTSGLF